MDPKCESSHILFKVVVEELRGADRIADDEYKTVLLAFINCLIISTPELKGGKQTWIWHSEKYHLFVEKTALKLNMPRIQK